MSYNVKGGRIVKDTPSPRKVKVGDMRHVDWCRDAVGNYYWRDQERPQDFHGPFSSCAEAEANFQLTELGPQCEVVDGGEFTAEVRETWEAVRESQTATKQ